MMVPGMVLLIPNYIIIQHIPFFGGNDWMGNGGAGLAGQLRRADHAAAW